MKESKFGKNQTGAEFSPENVNRMLDACKKFSPDVRDKNGLKKTRIEMIQAADQIGSVPLAPSLKGVVKISIDKLMGNEPKLFLDKLGERFAYERTGVRLYEAALAKAYALKSSKATIAIMEQIKYEEEEHMEIVKKAIKKMDADPTAMTPCADIAGVMAQGFMQILTDPRTDMPQCLNALLNIELIDNAAWELLIVLAHSFNESLITSFQKALMQENEHVVMIKGLLQENLC